MGENQKSRNVSVIKDVDGNNIVMINDIIFKGRQAINWEDVEKYLMQYVGEFYTIADNNEVVYIGTDLPDEYTHSEYTNILKGANAKAKANVTQGLPELIEIASGIRFTPNTMELSILGQSLNSLTYSYYAARGVPSSYSLL